MMGKRTLKDNSAERKKGRFCKSSVNICSGCGQQVNVRRLWEHKC